MKSKVMAYFCVAYGPRASEQQDSTEFKRANPYGTKHKPLPAVMMIHRDIDAPLAIGISQLVEGNDPRRGELQQGDPNGRVRIGRFHATIEQAVEEMKETWTALQSRGLVYAEVCCMEVSMANAGNAA